MGLGNALRRLWFTTSSEQAATSHAEHSSSRSSRRKIRLFPRTRRHSHHILVSATSYPTDPLVSPSPPQSPTTVPSVSSGIGAASPPPITNVPQPPRKVERANHRLQEVAVISNYQAKVRSHAATLDALWRRFGAEPDNARLTVQLRHHRAELFRALESYFAALGSRSTLELPFVVTTLETTDVRLEELDRQMFSEVDRLESTATDIAAKFANVTAADLRAHISADADDALIELQLYDDSWGNIMDESTRTRLCRAADLLRDVLQNAPKTRSSPLPDDFELEYGHTPNKHYGQFRKQVEGSTLPMFKSDVRRCDKDVAANSALAVSPTAPSPSPAMGKLEQVSSSESGDDAPLRMVMSRTRTLRDMAATALSGPDDMAMLASQSSLMRDAMHDMAAGAPTSPEQATANAPASVSMSVTASASASVSASTTSATTDKQASQTAYDAEQANPTVSKNMSFASTLYHTNNARVDAISDAGVSLERSIVRGDGRCLFRALARCRSAAKSEPRPTERVEREEADQLRLRAVAELKKYRDLLARFFVIEGNFTQYTKKMSLPRTYGGEPELLVLAKVLHIPIAVYITKGDRYRQIQVYGKQYRGDPLRILYSDGVHYDALLPCEGR